MEITRSSFLRGRNSDVDPAVVSNDSYLEAHNLTLTGDEKFLALENIKGTELVGADVADGTSAEVIQSIPNVYLIDSVATNCLTVFTARTNTFEIFCYDPASDTSYKIFTQTYSGYLALNPVVDAYTYPEQGVDVVYFTDGINEMRKLRCEFSTPVTAFTEAELSLQRLQPSGKVTLSSVADGGTLLCGTYVLAHRLVNADRNTYSKWSPFTAPVHINQSDLSTSQPYLANGTYNFNSSQKIQISVAVSAAENSIYTHYQIGVIQRTAVTTALTLDLQPIQDLTGATSYNFTFRENTRIDSLDLSDVVVDDAAIESVKTLVVKNNKLFAGNVTYHNLEFDNGEPAAISGSILKEQSGTSREAFAQPDMASKYKGYFRDEVYRFGVVYFDKYGNYSKVKVLDMANVTANASTQSTFKDMKFPSRRNPDYHVFGTSDYLQSLGLRLEINNHPSWAKGFVIVRTNRKKNIVAQTPILDCSELNGIEVVGDYPTIWVDDTTGEKTNESNTPMNPLGTLAPKNLFWTERRHIVKSNTTGTLKQKGEVYWGTDNDVTSTGQVGSPSKYACIFPQDDMYEGSGFENKEYDWELVDYAFLRLKKSEISGTYDSGESKDTEIHGTFYADAKTDYFCSSLDPVTGNIFDPTLDTYTKGTGKIIDYKLIDNSSPGTTIGSYFFQNYGNLLTGGFTNYVAPAAQRMGVVQMETPRSLDVADYVVNGEAGTLIAPSGQTIPADFFPATITNKFDCEYGTYDEATEYANAIEVANITNGLTDDRYGSVDDLHEFISTGTVYNLSDAEVSGNTPITVDVWGGDCFVSMHSFKITDGYFGVANNYKYETASTESETTVFTKWGANFDTTTTSTTPLSYPVPYKTVSTVLSVVLESEYNGSTTSKAPLGYSTTVSGNYQIPFSTSKGTWKIPFSYGYNKNYNISNTEKVFLPPYDGQLNVEELKARVVYSDQKVYQTGVSGFDRIRVSNTLDLDETYGGITKLALAGDDMIAVQDMATSYLPVDASTTETTDGTTLSIRSSEVIGLPTYISRRYGSQHMRSVLQADRTIFFVDNLNQLAVRIADRGLELISEKGAVKQFNTWLGSSVASDNIVTCYDFVRKQAWFLGIATCEIWDDRLACWIGDYQFPTTLVPPTAVNINYGGENHLMILSTISGGNLRAHNMYEGDYNSLLGSTVTPSVKFSVNDKFDVSKTFDNLVVYASDKLNTITIQGEKETGATGNEVSGIDIDKERREGNYRVQVPYDVNRSRVRGTRANITAFWRTDNEKVVLTSIVTKYRTSPMII